MPRAKALEVVCLVSQLGLKNGEGRQRWCCCKSYYFNDIHHVGFWAMDMAKQQRSTDIENAAMEFTKCLPFIYSHLASICSQLSFFFEKLLGYQII